MKNVIFLKLYQMSRVYLYTNQHNQNPVFYSGAKICKVQDLRKLGLELVLKIPSM